MARVREDERFKTIGPEDIIMPYRFPTAMPPSSSGPQGSPGQEEVEIWFDWAFVDFWKSNYCEFGDVSAACTQKDLVFVPEQQQIRSSGQ